MCKLWRHLVVSKSETSVLGTRNKMVFKSLTFILIEIKDFLCPAWGCYGNMAQRPSKGDPYRYRDKYFTSR